MWPLRYIYWYAASCVICMYMYLAMVSPAMLWCDSFCFQIVPCHTLTWECRCSPLSLSTVKQVYRWTYWGWGTGIETRDYYLVFIFSDDFLIDKFLGILVHQREVLLDHLVHTRLQMACVHTYIYNHKLTHRTAKTFCWIKNFTSPATFALQKWFFANLVKVTIGFM